jgi:hypothetical protein
MDGPPGWRVAAPSGHERQNAGMTARIELPYLLFLFSLPGVAAGDLRSKIGDLKIIPAFAGLARFEAAGSAT